MRRGDCCLLKRNDVDFEKEIISITPNKTKESSAKQISIPLHSSLAKVLKERPEDPNGYFMPKLASRYNNPSQRPRISNAWTRILKEAGIVASKESDGRKRAIVEYGFHSYRHSFVSFCARAGVPMAFVQDIVGHNNPQTTKVYTHINNESLKQAIQAQPDNTQNAEPKEIMELKRKISQINVQTLEEFKKRLIELTTTED